MANIKGVGFITDELLGLNKPTNADRIRGLDDVELAFLLDSFRCGNCMRRGNNCFPGSLEDWLQQPAKEEHHEAN